MKTAKHTSFVSDRKLATLSQTTTLGSPFVDPKQRLHCTLHGAYGSECENVLMRLRWEIVIHRNEDDSLPFLRMTAAPFDL